MMKQKKIKLKKKPPKHIKINPCQLKKPVTTSHEPEILKYELKTIYHKKNPQEQNK